MSLTMTVLHWTLPVARATARPSRNTTRANNASAFVRAPRASASGSFRSRMQPSRGVRRGVVTRAAAAADVPADEGPSMTKNLSLAFDSSCRVTADEPDNVTPTSDALWASVCVFCAFLILGFIDMQLSPTGVPLMIGSYGTISILLFGAPDAPVLNVWNVVVGHLSAAAIVIMWMKVTFMPIWIRRAVAMATTLPFMLLTGSVHPPGGALVLTLVDSAKMQGLGWWYLICPGMLGLLVLLPMSALSNWVKKNYAFTWGPSGFKWLGKLA